MGRIFLGDQINKLNPEFRIFLGFPLDDGSNEIVNGGEFEFPSDEEYFAFLYPKKYSLIRGNPSVFHDDYRQGNPYLAYSVGRGTASASGVYADKYNQEFRSIDDYYVRDKPADADFHIQLRVDPEPPVIVVEPEPEPEPEIQEEQIFGEGLTIIENEAYRGKGISGAITIADGVTTIGTGAFRNNQITSINLPDSLESIGTLAFDDNQLTSVVFGNSLTIIKDRAFRNNQITSILIPYSVTSIEYDVFRSNPLLEVSIGSNTIYDPKSFPESVIITVRDETELPVEPEPEPVEPEPEPEPEPVEPEPVEPEILTISFTYKEGKGFYNKFRNMTTQYTNGETVTVEGEYSTDVPITFTAEEGYYLDNIVIDVDGKESSIFLGSQDITTKELIAKNVKPNSVVTVWGYGKEKPSDNVIYSENLVNATSSMAGESELIKGEHTITFYANEGFEFDSVGTYTMNGTDYEFYASGKEHTLTIDVQFDLAIDLVAVPLSVSDSISPFINIYEVTRQELGELSLERFSDEYLDLQTGVTSSGVDYGDMIVNLIRIPYDIPEYVVRTREPIKLGKFVTTTMSNAINTNHIEIKLGTVKVEGEKGNVADYKNVRAFLYIPYADRMELPIEYVMDNKVEVALEIDLFSGNGVITVTSQDVPVYKNMVVMSEQIPFVQLRDTTYSNKVNALLYGTIKPFISLETHEVVEQVALPTQKDVTLNSLTGYVEVDRILSIDTKASVSEQAEILGLLQRGVEIK